MIYKKRMTFFQGLPFQFSMHSPKRITRVVVEGRALVFQGEDDIQLEIQMPPEKRYSSLQCTLAEVLKIEKASPF